MRLVETHIEVKDVEKSLELYKNMIPHKKILRWSQNNVAALVLYDGSAFGIWKEGHKGIHNGSAGKRTHFAFQINQNEYENYKNKIIECKLEVLEYDWENGYKSLYFFDYDGHQGEFMTGNWIELNDL